MAGIIRLLHHELEIKTWIKFRAILLFNLIIIVDLFRLGLIWYSKPWNVMNSMKEQAELGAGTCVVVLVR